MLNRLLRLKSKLMDRSLPTTLWSRRERDTEKWLRRTADIFENSQNGIVIANARGTIGKVNAAFTAITGYSPEEAMGQPPWKIGAGSEKRAYVLVRRSLRRHGGWQGEIRVRRKGGEAILGLLTIDPIRNRRGQITHYLGLFSDITRLRQEQQKSELLPDYDRLTGLPDRAHLEYRLRQAMACTNRQGKLLAVCSLDIDDFGAINKALGHRVGNQVLAEVAQRLRQAVRECDTVARIGGDEFVLLLNGLESLENTRQVMERLMQAISCPMESLGVLRLSGSAGVTLYPRDGSDPDTLLRHAGRALYEAKAQGRAAFQMFDTLGGERAQGRRRIIEAVRDGLSSQQFRLFYQPAVSLASGQVVGMEALIRWTHPEQGLLGPADFLPALLDPEMAVIIDQWVLAEALKQLSLWAETGFQPHVSINISAHSLQRPGLGPWLRQLLACHPRVGAERLELEILETALLDDLPGLRRFIEAWGDLGITFALDDFGTGYSSLSYLKQLPASTIKIDRSFIANILTDPEDRAIVASTVALAHAFQRRVIAEGVETPAQGRLLLQLGCDVVQGYGLARPMPAENIKEWISRFRLAPEWQSESC